MGETGGRAPAEAAKVAPPVTPNARAAGAPRNPAIPMHRDGTPRRFVQNPRPDNGPVQPPAEPPASTEPVQHRQPGLRIPQHPTIMMDRDGKPIPMIQRRRGPAAGTETLAAPGAPEATPAMQNATPLQFRENRPVAPPATPDAENPFVATPEQQAAPQAPEANPFVDADPDVPQPVSQALPAEKVAQITREALSGKAPTREALELLAMGNIDKARLNRETTRMMKSSNADRRALGYDVSIARHQFELAHSEDEIAKLEAFAAKIAASGEKGATETLEAKRSEISAKKANLEAQRQKVIELQKARADDPKLKDKPDAMRALVGKLMHVEGDEAAQEQFIKENAAEIAKNPLGLIGKRLDQLKRVYAEKPAVLKALSGFNKAEKKALERYFKGKGLSFGQFALGLGVVGAAIAYVVLQRASRQIAE